MESNNRAIIILDLQEMRKRIEAGVEDSREKSLALTKLDECVLWLKEA